MGYNKRLITISIIIVIAISIFAVSLFFLKNDSKTNSNEPVLIPKQNSEINLKSEVTQTTTFEENYTSLGQTITSSEVEKRYEILSAQLKQETTKQEVAESIATQNLLIKEAEIKNVVVTDQEVDDFISTTRTQFQISEADYQQKLVQYGITEDQYEEQLKEQILLSKLVAEEINPADYEVTDKEVDDYMQLHKEDYAVLFEDNDVSALNYVKTQLKQQMKNKKQQDLIVKYVEELKVKGVVS